MKLAPGVQGGDALGELTEGGVQPEIIAPAKIRFSRGCIG